MWKMGAVGLLVAMVVAALVYFPSKPTMTSELVAAAREAPTMPKAAPTDSILGRDAAKSAKARASSEKLRANMSLLRDAMKAARAERKCATKVASACAELNQDRGALRKKLADAQKKLAAACQDDQPGACIRRGDLDRLASHEAQAQAWYTKARERLAAGSQACESGATSDLKCDRAAKLMRALDNRKTRAG